MAKDKKAAAQGENVVALTVANCLAEGCKKKGTRAQFCDEHFAWFKEGLITKEGKKPIDFDKKYQAWLARKAA